MGKPHVEFDRDRLEELSRKYHIRRLALFGSVLRDDFRTDSDIDVLVEFEKEARVGFMALGRMRRELADLLGRQVDLVPRDGLKSQIRDNVLGSAQVLYAA